MASQHQQSRIDWVDVAKGICIILVVMMHSTLGVEKAIGADTPVHAFIEWARPFRMPDFFLISGLFLAARIGRPWRSYLDTKVVHFAYFYVLWVNIQFAMKAPGMVGTLGLQDTALNYLASYVQPFGTLWFIYLLAIFFIVTKLLRDVSKPLVLVAAAVLHMTAPHTGSLVIDEFADRFVFFYTGYAAAPLVLALADRIGRQAALPLIGLLVAWAWLNWLAVDVGPRRAGRDRSAVRLRRCARGGRVQRAAGARRLGFMARLLRAAIDRHLSGLPAVHGARPHPAAEAGTPLARRQRGTGNDGSQRRSVLCALFWLVQNTRAKFLFVRPEAFKLKPATGRTAGYPAAAAQPSPARSSGRAQEQGTVSTAPTVAKYLLHSPARATAGAWAAFLSAVRLSSGCGLATINRAFWLPSGSRMMPDLAWIRSRAGLPVVGLHGARLQIGNPGLRHAGRPEILVDQALPGGAIDAGRLLGHGVRCATPRGTASCW